MFDDMPVFCATEVAVLRDAYSFALSYLSPLTKGERSTLANLILAAAGTRIRSGDGLDTFIDSHVLAAETVDIFAVLQLIGSEDAD